MFGDGFPFSIVKNESFKVLSQHLNGVQGVAIAFSGGKDSTALALLLLEWVSEMGRSDLDVMLVHSDTLSEIPEMELWTREFMEIYRAYAKRIGVDVETIITRPEAINTFYWRVLVRGYPAPTFSFRWCVELLKRKPSREALKLVKGLTLLLGHRDDESGFRLVSLARRGMICPLTAGKCGAYYYNIDEGVTKVYPIRSWSTAHVWEYLRFWRSKINYLTKLFKLYLEGALPARYGCWHCTLIKKQLAHYILDKNYLYLEAARLLIRWISDVEWMRIPKDKGYSRLGPLTPVARAILAKVVQTAEKLSKIRLYGLDEPRINGYTIRELLFEVPPQEANKIIREAEQKSIEKSPWRFVDIEVVRDLDIHREQVIKFIEYVNRQLVNVDNAIKEYVIVLLNSLKVNLIND